MGRALVVISVVAVLALSSPCCGETITVDLGGNGDYSEVQAAIDAAGHGASVKRS